MPSGEAERRDPPAGLIAVIAVTLVLRLVVGRLTHLTEDEAYYRMWSMAPALGYYDHPPMIAWWVRAGMGLAGDNPLGVRLLPVLSSGLASLVVFDIASRIGASERAAAQAHVPHVVETGLREVRREFVGVGKVRQRVG